MKTLALLLLLAISSLIGGCHMETNEEEAARFEKAEREAGYPARGPGTLRPRSSANF